MGTDLAYCGAFLIVYGLSVDLQLILIKLVSEVILWALFKLIA